MSSVHTAVRSGCWTTFLRCASWLELQTPVGQHLSRHRWPDAFDGTCSQILPCHPEEPTGQNPPDGAILDYFLPAGAEDVTLEIVTTHGEVLRRYSSEDPPEIVDPETLPHPTYWIRPPQSLGTSAGHHRFVWDLRREPPPGARRQFAIAAVLESTPSGPHRPFVHPGEYLVRLTVDGQVAERPVEVRLDPRVEIDQESLQQQTDLSLRCYFGYLKAQEIREAIEFATENTAGERLTALQALRGQGTPGEPDIHYDYIVQAGSAEESVVDLQYKFLWVLYVLQGADARPTSQTQEAVMSLERSLGGLIQREVGGSEVGTRAKKPVTSSSVPSFG